MAQITLTPPAMPMGRKRIAVMTSGGDSPGMSGAVRAVVRQTLAEGCTSYAVYEGYEGLVQGGDMIREMRWEDVRGWLSEGGTLIGTARCKSFMERYVSWKQQPTTRGSDSGRALERGVPGRGLLHYLCHAM